MNQTAFQRLIHALETVADALAAGDYPEVERRIASYGASLRECFSQSVPALSADECGRLQHRHAELHSQMQQLRDGAAQWLRNDRRTRHVIQAYSHYRGGRHGGVGLR